MVLSVLHFCFLISELLDIRAKSIEEKESRLVQMLLIGFDGGLLFLGLDYEHLSEAIILIIIVTIITIIFRIF